MKLPDLQKIKSTFIKTTNRQQAGLACLASVVRYYGGDAEMQKLLKNSGAAVNSVTLLGLCKTARVEGFEANGYRGDTNFLKEQETPVILHIEKDAGYDDFVVVYGWQNNKFIVADPHWGIIEYREDELIAVWKSRALMLLEPGKSFESVKDKQNEKQEWLSKLFKSQKKNLILNGLAGALLAIAFVVIFQMMENTIEPLFAVKAIKNFGIKIALLFIFVLAFISIALLKNSIATRGIKSFINEFNNYLAKSVFNPSTDRGKQSAGLTSSLSNAVQQFGGTVVEIVSNVPFYSVLLIAALAYVSIHLVWTGVFIFISSVVLIGIIWLRRKKIRQLSVMRYNAEIQETDTLTNNFEYYKYIQLTNSENFFSSITENVLNYSIETEKKLMTEKNKNTAWFVIFSAIIVLGVIVFLLTSGYENQIANLNLLGWLIVYLWGLNRFINLVIDYFQLKIPFNFLYDNLGKEPSNFDEHLAGLSKPLVRPKTNLSVERLSFSYPGKLPVFQNISFTAEKGKIMAVFGKTGSGKSTMVSLLNRLLPLESGDITVDGASWQPFNNIQWRKYSSTVLQPVQLFNSSIIENIGWGEKSMDQEKITTFCKQTGFDKFFAKLPDGYATNCNNISAGQKQMVALAAAIYRKPEILLLDEPLACMDDEMKEFCWQLFHQLKTEMVILIFTGNKEWANKADSLVSLVNENF